MNDDDSLLSSVRGIAASLQALHQQAMRQYTPVVESIMRLNSRDTRHIQHTLDGLLDFCGYAPALLLYRRLCRYYFQIDPAVTAEYVQAYRDFYDSADMADASTNRRHCTTPLPPLPVEAATPVAGMAEHIPKTGASWK